jgi:hypothetical protein
MRGPIPKTAIPEISAIFEYSDVRAINPLIAPNVIATPKRINKIPMIRSHTFTRINSDALIILSLLMIVSFSKL